ncbi:MAG: hypothetical protein ACJ8DL_15740 [Microvirga sp.]
MRTFVMTAAAATLFAGVALAQPMPVNPNDKAPAKQQTQGNVPFYQQGSGQQAGGPANELNTNGPMTTGTIVVPVPAEPMPPSGVVGVEVMPGAPQALDGKGQAAGGYVGEAKRRDGIQ